MRWRFTLYDRNDTRTVIDEPLGWDAFTLKIKRHQERHGTFREIQGNQFQFHGIAQELLKAEHDQYGIRGNYRLQIEQKCKGGWEEVYFGKVGFDGYKFTCGTSCSVTVDLEQIGPVVEFINRFDQKVDLSKGVAFDGTTPLTAYAKLTQEILLPSKAVLLRGLSKNTAVQEYVISNDSAWTNAFPSGTGLAQGAIVVPFSTTDVNSIKDYRPKSVMDFYSAGANEYVPELLYNKPEQDLNCTGTQFNIEIRAKGIFKNLVTGNGRHSFVLVLKKGREDFYRNATVLQSWDIMPVNSLNSAIQQPYDISYTGTVNLQPGDKCWLDFYLSYRKDTNYSADVRLQVDPETFFKVSLVSKCDASTAKLYMINETASRVIESITNGGLKLYSEYYGRRDSQPFSFPQNGCGGLRALTTGLDIRKAKLADGSDPKMFLSMKDVFDNLNAIDNIGVGPEGTDRIRMENWKFFYQDTVVFSCRDIEKLEKVTQASLHYSTFKAGYDKWEAEDYNGLDEFLTKREYRTALSEVQNELSKLCKFIASGYAWEVTRRRQNDSKDWRFDNDTFILCLTDKIKSAAFTSATNSFNIIAPVGSVQIGDSLTVTGSVSNNGTYTVSNVVQILNSLQVYVSATLVTENAPNALIENNTRPFAPQAEVGNITGAANILDPATVYNFRISPERNAMRWFDRVAACYRNITNADKLHFSAGDGNYLATGQLSNAFCRLEAGALKESDDISISTFQDPADGTPIAHPERVNYTYPVSAEDYNTIKAQPYGLIEYQSGCEQGVGWIDEIEWNAEAGTAKFSLIPKIES